MNMETFESEYPVRLIDSKTDKISTIKRAFVVVSLVLLAFIVFVLMNGALFVWLLGNNLQKGAAKPLNFTASALDEEVCDNIPQVPILPMAFRPLHAYQTGWDNEGAPVWIVEIGDFDFRSQLEKNEANEHLILHLADIVLIQIKCSMVMSAKSLSGDNSKSNLSLSWSAITDMGEFSLLQLASFTVINVIKTAATAWSPVFPNVKYGFITEASWIVRRLFGILSPILGDAYHKLFMYGDKRQYIPAILDKIPRDQLPEKYGGFSNYTCRTDFCKKWPLRKIR